MKLHDLRPPDGSNTARTRVGRGIAAGKGKTAGRGTKGQKARAGGSIPPWFEGGQTPLHMRIPKLRGFENRAKIDYEVVNVGDIAARIEAGSFAEAGTTPKKGEQLTINADILRAVGLVRNVKKPLKILGSGELATALFVVADAYTKSATAKIEAAGGIANVLEIPAESLPALGLDGEAIARPARVARTAAGRDAADRKVDARARRATDAAELEAETAAIASAKTERPKKEKATATSAPDGAEASADAPARARAAAPVETAAPTEPEDAGASADEPADAPDAPAAETAATPASGDDTDGDAAAGDNADGDDVVPGSDEGA